MPYRFTRDNSYVNPKFNPPFACDENNSNIVNDELKKGALTPDAEDYLRSVRVHTNRPFSKMPDVFGLTTGAFYCSTRLREIIESFEKRTVDWRSVDVVGKGIAKDGVNLRDSDDLHPNSYHALICTTFIDCVDETKGEVHYATSTITGVRFVTLDPHSNVWIIWPDAVDGYHLWRGGGNFTSFWLMSDALHNVLKAEKIKGFEFTHCPFDAEVSVEQSDTVRAG